MALPPLAAFRFFNAAAQSQSFVKAAQALHITHGAVSRQVRSLEDAMGVELFERRNRAVFLNAAGQRLLAVTAPLFEQLEKVVDQLQHEVRDEVIVVSCEPTIAMKWLIPRLGDFHRLHPHLQVQLLAAGGPIDFARSGADLAIRRDDFHWGSAVHSVVLCQEVIGPVCIPGLLPLPEGFAGMRLLRSKTRQQAWRQWQQSGAAALANTSTADYEHFYLCIQAACAGLGIAMASRLMVQEELRSGQLTAPLGFIPDGSRYCLLAPRPFENGKKCGLFLSWLQEQLR